VYAPTQKCEPIDQKNTRRKGATDASKGTQRTRSETYFGLLADGVRGRYPQIAGDDAPMGKSIFAVYGWRQFQDGTIEITVGT
jgi:hypothetical protein